MAAAADTIHFQEADYDLPGLETLTWELLHRASLSGRDLMHTGVLSSMGEEDFPASRTMVLRQVDAERRLLASYSDVRAPKIDGIRRSPNVSWVFYDPRRRIEVRVMGKMRVFTGEGDSLAEAVWASMTGTAKQAFLGERPTGSQMDARAADVVNTAPTDDESRQGYANFAVLLTFVERLEFLYLHHGGHHRARFHYKEEDLVQSHWVST